MMYKAHAVILYLGNTLIDLSTEKRHLDFFKMLFYSLRNTVQLRLLGNSKYIEKNVSAALSTDLCTSYITNGRMISYI